MRPGRELMAYFVISVCVVIPRVIFRWTWAINAVMVFSQRLDDIIGFCCGSPQCILVWFSYEVSHWKWKLKCLACQGPETKSPNHKIAFCWLFNGESHGGCSRGSGSYEGRVDCLAITSRNL